MSKYGKGLLIILLQAAVLFAGTNSYAATSGGGTNAKKKHVKKHKVKRVKRNKNYMEGPASFYAHKFNGRKMANGDRYWADVYTAAHARLPLGTKLKVTNIDNDADNGKILYVEVTDRMSSRSRYILDLSPAAARYLNNTGRGLRVKLQVVSNTEFESHDMNKSAESNSDNS